MFSVTLQVQKFREKKNLLYLDEEIEEASARVSVKSSLWQGSSRWGSAKEILGWEILIWCFVDRLQVGEDCKISLSVLAAVVSDWKISEDVTKNQQEKA